MTSACAVFGDEDRKLLQVSADEVPDAVFGSGFEFETFLKAAVGFVGGNDQVLLDGTCCVTWLIGSLLFVQRPDISHDETRASALLPEWRSRPRSVNCGIPPSSSVPV